MQLQAANLRLPCALRTGHVHCLTASNHLDQAGQHPEVSESNSKSSIFVLAAICREPGRGGKSEDWEQMMALRDASKGGFRVLGLRAEGLGTSFSGRSKLRFTAADQNIALGV